MTDVTTPTPLDALKYVCLLGADQLDFIIDRASLDDLPEDINSMLVGIRDMMHEALQTQVPADLTPPRWKGGSWTPHSNTYWAANTYSDGSPVYVDSHEPIVRDDPEVGAFPTTEWHRHFLPMPVRGGGDCDA